MSVVAPCPPFSSKIFLPGRSIVEAIEAADLTQQENDIIGSPIAPLFPDPIKVDGRERARSLLGAMIGLFLTGGLSQLAIGGSSNLPWLIAPMGASTVLLFAVPASPLAQPWSVLGGNLVSALVGVACAKAIGVPLA